MDRALIISDSEKATGFFEKFLKERGISAVRAVSDAAMGKQIMSDGGYELCFVNSPVHGMSGESLAIDLAATGSAQVILFVKSELYEGVAGKVRDDGVIVIEKPIHPGELSSALDVVEASEARVLKMQREVSKLKQKLEETKVVSRAKCVLIEKKGMSEADAHRYIEKQAMDKRISRRNVAEDILDFYD
ncbi:MAG: ANTAR domain-containing protein [Lachnospiraceae bacterium]|nr:ANTAR domain-containing protein [Lachnospiraceae bacterium]